MYNSTIALLGFLILSCFTLQAQLIHDESYTDQTFWEFKTKLETAVINEDIQAFEQLLADSVSESRWGCLRCAKDEFLRILFEDDSSKVWTKMKRVLRYGFSKTLNPQTDEYTFVAPSFRKHVDEDYSYIMILGNEVNIREKPNTQSKIIRQVSFEKILCECHYMKKLTSYQTIGGVDWVELKLKEKQFGYVAAKYTSYTMIKSIKIAKVNGEWKVIAYFHPPP